MNPSEINKRIAEGSGWTDLEVTAPQRGSMTPRWMGKHEALPKKWKAFAPNYYCDLNAIHEAVMSLDFDQQVKFQAELEQIIRVPENILFGDKLEKKFPLNGHGKFAVSTATAPQRCEAFLRTLGLWEEQK